MRILNKMIWPYRIIMRVKENATNADLWCEERFGNRSKEWYSYNIGPESRMYAFKDEESYIMFKLSWESL